MHFGRRTSIWQRLVHFCGEKSRRRAFQTVSHFGGVSSGTDPREHIARLHIFPFLILDALSGASSPYTASVFGDTLHVTLRSHYVLEQLPLLAPKAKC
ncbi:unnamed protein product [Ixodes pacificus]